MLRRVTLLLLGLLTTSLVLADVPARAPQAESAPDQQHALPPRQTLPQVRHGDSGEEDNTVNIPTPHPSWFMRHTVEPLQAGATEPVWRPRGRPCMEIERCPNSQ